MEVAWDHTWSADGQDVLLDAVPLPDGGWVLAGESKSNTDLDKSAPYYGGVDIWLVRLDRDGQVLWQNAYGGSKDETYGKLLALPDGGFLLCATSNSLASGSKTANYFASADFWIVRLDDQGNQIWDKCHGSRNDEHLTSVVSLPDGGFLLGGESLFSDVPGGDRSSKGYAMLDLWLMRIDTDGNKVWDKALGGYFDEYLYQMLPSEDGGFYILGRTQSWAGGTKRSQTGSPGLYWDYLAIKIASNGSLVWEQGFGGFSWEYFFQGARAPQGGLLLGGWSKSETPSGNKTSSNHGASDEDYWVVSVGSEGAKRFDLSYGGTGPDHLRTLTPAGNGRYWLAGYSWDSTDGDHTGAGIGGGVDAWVAQIDAQGRKLWDQAYGTGFKDTVYDMIPGSYGGAWLLGGQMADTRYPEPTTIEASPGAGPWLQEIRAGGEPGQWFQWTNAPLTFFHSLRQGNEGDLLLVGYTVDAGFKMTGHLPATNNVVVNSDYRVIKLQRPLLPTREPGNGAQVLVREDLQGLVEQDGLLVSLLGEPDTAYVLESSGDLLAWQPVSTNTVGQTELRIRDRGAAGAPRRFYRTKTLEP